MPENEMPELMSNVLPPSEAGFSVNFFLNHNALGRVMFTFRGAMSSDWGGVLEDLGRFTKYMTEEKGWKFDGDMLPKPSEATKATVMATALSPAPAPSKSEAPALAGPVDTGINTLKITRVVVVPKPDDKVELQLFAPGHKYPDLYHKGAIKNVLTALQPTGYDWTEDHLRLPADMQVSFEVDWRNSEKLNDKGKPYKNIVNYRAIDAAA